MSSRIVKAQTTPHVAEAKAILYRTAFKRIERAIAQGFHLEAITILESLICDRIETTISVVSAQENYPNTLGPLLKQLKKMSVFPEELISELDMWRKERNLVMHQMVKITNIENTNWQSRMKFARLIAIQGKFLLKEVQTNTNRIKRIYGGK